MIVWKEPGTFLYVTVYDKKKLVVYGHAGALFSELFFQN